jgi:hypothetical protein
VAYVPVNAVKCFDLFLAAVLTEVFEEVLFPYVGCNGLALICRHVVLDVGKEDLKTAESAFYANVSYLVCQPESTY